MIFQWIKNKLINRMYNSCKEELEFTKNFYRHNVWGNPRLKEKTGVELQEFYEREIYVHIAHDIYKIYRAKFGDTFDKQLKEDAFGYQDILNSQVKFLFEESCLNATRK